MKADGPNFGILWGTQFCMHLIFCELFFVNFLIWSKTSTMVSARNKYINFVLFIWYLQVVEHLSFIHPTDVALLNRLCKLATYYTNFSDFTRLHGCSVGKWWTTLSHLLKAIAFQLHQNTLWKQAPTFRFRFREHISDMQLLVLS